jgi:hypothetical protein
MKLLENEVNMITYIKDYNSVKETKENLVVSQVNNSTFINPVTPTLNGEINIPYDTLIDFLNDKGNLDGFDLFSFANFLKATPINTVISQSRIQGEKLTTSIDELEKEYEKFSLESKMKFPYSINLYSSNHIISFFNNLKNAISELNYLAYVSDSKLDIDGTLHQLKTNVLYELWVEMSSSNDNKQAEVTTQEMILKVISPYVVGHYLTQSLPNNPFRNSQDYINSLITPYKYKISILEYTKELLNLNTNTLLAKLLEGGLYSLQKDVVTYRSDDIIKLFLICNYIFNVLVEYVIIFSQEFHDIADFIHGEVTYGDLSGQEVHIPLTVHELFGLVNLEGDRVYTAYTYSGEAENTMGMSDNVRLNEIDEAYKRKWAQLQKAYIKIFKVGISKILSRANAFFFKKYYGRIPHLYSQYAGRALVVENTMVGDPGEVLSSSCVEYVQRMSNDSTELFNVLLQLARRITSITNVEEKVNAINSFCKKFPIDKAKMDNLKHNILNETRYRIATSILQDNEIYGFTVEGILQNKKFPPANHIVTSLFVQNPHEKPKEQSVGDIFSGEKSILQFAHPENIVKFNNLYRQSASKIIDTFNPKVASLTEKNLNKATRRFTDQIAKYEMDENSMKEVDPKEQKKISNDIDKSIIKAIDMTIAQKRRCLQCAGIAHDMIGRVTELAKRCVVSMLNVEKSVTDTANGKKPAYKSGNKITNNRTVNKKLDANKKYIESNRNLSETRRRRTNTSIYDD